MKKYLIVIGLFLSIRASSQEIARNTVFGEVFGAAGFYSVNYERFLRDNNNINFTLRAGFSYIHENRAYQYKSDIFIFPMSLSILKNIQKNHFIEVRLSVANILNYKTYEYSSGLGDTSRTPLHTPIKELEYGIYPSLGLGYRYQPSNKGLFFNFLVQRIPNLSKELWYTNLSVGIGYAF
jgi:hypothetical protein